MFKNFNLASIVSIIIIGLFVGVIFVYANWTAPISSPPTCVAGNPGCDAPINVSINTQTINNGTKTIQTRASGGIIGGGVLILDGALFVNGLLGASNFATAHVPSGTWVLVGISTANGPGDQIITGNVINYIAPQPVIGIRMRATGFGDPVACESFSNNLFSFFHGKGDTSGGNGWNYINNLPLNSFPSHGWKSGDIGVDDNDDSSGGGAPYSFFFGGGRDNTSGGGCGNSPDIPVACDNMGNTMGQAWKVSPGLNFVPQGKIIQFRTVGASDTGNLSVACQFEVLLGTPVY